MFICPTDIPGLRQEYAQCLLFKYCNRKSHRAVMREAFPRQDENKKKSWDIFTRCNEEIFVFYVADINVPIPKLWLRVCMFISIDTVDKVLNLEGQTPPRVHQKLSISLIDSPFIWRSLSHNHSLTVLLKKSQERNSTQTRIPKPR